MTIGNNVYIGDNFYCNCEGKLVIESGTIMSNNCMVMTYNHDYNTEGFLPYGLGNIYKDVIIKENVWVGINVNIVPGVIIGARSIIGMGTTVTKSIPEGVIYGGGKILSERKQLNKKYDLLAVRTIYNPIHYIKFIHIFSNIVKKTKRENPEWKNKIEFDKIKAEYKANDYLSMIYVLSTNRGYEVDWQNDFVKISND